MSKSPTLFWFRNDLRLSDNPGLSAAVERGAPVIPVFILEDEEDGARPPGGAAKWWLDKSLKSLRSAVSDRGGKLILKRGAAQACLDEVIEETGADAVFWNRRYRKADRDRDAEIKSALSERGLDVQSFNGRLLTEPWAHETSSGGPYKVFTPYWRSVRDSYQAPDPLDAPDTLSGQSVDGDRIEDWGLHPSNPDWSEGFDEFWTPGEDAARNRLDAFLKDGIKTYDDCRNRPDMEGTSRLSPHLHHGEISPVTVWRAVRTAMEDGRRDIPDDQAMTFLSEIVWREFSYVLLYHFPEIETENYNDDFDAMPWRSSKSDLGAWQKGQTGYPIVDAGMRQLWQTGWMHNRVRMIVASFLTKHLLIDWREGETWFWDCLVDADPASNVAGWQWTAGSGADAAPYFRVFNPITQGEKFDETCAYVRRYVPELKDLPKKHLYAPWEAPDSVLDKAGITLGETYPEPLIAHKDGRQRALDAYDTVKEQRNTE